MIMIRNNILLLFALLFLVLPGGNAQLYENFSDGDFTRNPEWMGDTAAWSVNGNYELQSANVLPNAVFYLSTQSSLALGTRWQLNVRLEFNTSSVNYADIFLTASAPQLSAATVSGYFLRLGGATDEISLYRKVPGSAPVKLIDGIDGILNRSTNILSLDIRRDSSGTFTLYHAIDGNNFRFGGTVQDISDTASRYFGIMLRQSTASFFRKHFFSEIRIAPYVPDRIPPILLSATAVSASMLELLFDEPVDSATAADCSHYLVSNGVGNPLTALPDSLNAAKIRLHFSQAFPNGVQCGLQINGLADLSGNRMRDTSISFLHYKPGRYDLVIDEIMADPSPPGRLPEREWIELRNACRFPVNLQGWRIGDRGGLSGPLPNHVLLPDSMVIVCASASNNDMQQYGAVLAVSSFPSLDNSGDLVLLIDDRQQVIHAVEYALSWYDNPLKQQGGWSLEMKDVRDPCSASANWQASNDERGGTPGRINSVDGQREDVVSPSLVRAFAKDSMNIVVLFSEPVDSNAASLAGVYQLDQGIGNPLVAIPLGPLFNRVLLRFDQPLSPQFIYLITVSGINDCRGNLIGSRNKTRVALAAPSGTIKPVINELLFNPPPEGADFVELYNCGNRVIDLGALFLANRNTAGAISNIIPLSPEPVLLFPGSYGVITENGPWLIQRYIVPDSAVVLQVSQLPSYNDDAGSVVLLDAQGNLLDELRYAENWHFPLLREREAISLERISCTAPTHQKENWHSAASSTGYATPGKRNSQYRGDENAAAELRVSPAMITPDNDGNDDYLLMHYSFPESGYAATITVFDAAGRPIRYLQRNVLCGRSGSFRWDGLGEQGRQLATGIYILYTEVFNLAGKKKQFRNVVVVAGRR